MNNKVKDRHPDKKDKKNFTLRSAIIGGTKGVTGAASALAKANKAFKAAIAQAAGKARDSKKKNPHKD
tara:strand:+ start:270 stop:473 length:204 start_codon:yes stop_codon:yes gene_type:complete